MVDRPLGEEMAGREPSVARADDDRGDVFDD
jgi:hypothetical protein